MELDAHGLLAPGAAAAVDVEGGVWKGLKLEVEGGATVPLELTQGSKVTSALSVVEFNVRRSLMPDDEEGYVRENETCMHACREQEINGWNEHACRQRNEKSMHAGWYHRLTAAVDEVCFGEGLEVSEVLSGVSLASLARFYSDKQKIIVLKHLQMCSLKFVI